MKPGGIHGDAIHLAFHNDAVGQLAYGFFGFIQVVEHARLGIDRGLRRVQVFGAGLFVFGQRPAGKGDDLAVLLRDGEHDAIAELGVHRAGFSAFFPGEQA